MNDPENQKYLNRAVEITLRLGILAFIFGWVFLILSPFLAPVLWGIIIAIAVWPLYSGLRNRLKGRGTLASVLLTSVFILLLLIPAWLLADSLWEGIEHFREVYNEDQLTIPPPADYTKNWPGFTKPVIDAWDLASKNLGDAVIKFTPEIKKFGRWLLTLATSTGLGILQFLVSIIIAGVFLVYAEAGGGSIKKIFIRLAGAQGAHFAELSEITIRNVVKGVLGVAVTQALLAAIGFVVAGVPLAGLWTLACLILAIVQIGVGPVVLGVVIYMYATASATTATLLMIWLILVTLVDNFLKPLLLGRGAPAPMLVVFLGAIGGFIANGFMGLFLGPVILSLAYKLFQDWLEA